MARLILDASALLALLREEAGGDKVADVIDQAAISAVNYAEIVSYYVQIGAEPGTVSAMLDPLPMEVIPVDTALSFQAGIMRKATSQAGLSLGDRYCLALAAREGVAAWTADKAWQKIAAAVNVEIVMIR